MIPALRTKIKQFFDLVRRPGDKMKSFKSSWHRHCRDLIAVEPGTSNLDEWLMKVLQYFTTALLLSAFEAVGNSAPAVTIAADDASQSAYADGWQSGDNGGSGFGPWALDYSGLLPGLFHAPQFIDRLPLSGNSLGAPAFGLTTGNRDLFSDTSEARRSFSAPLGIGQTVSVDIDGSALDPAARKFSSGNTFQLFGTNGQERFGLYTNNGFLGDNWVVTGDINTGIPAAASFHMDFTLATANTYNLSLLPIGGGSPLFVQTGRVLTGITNTGINSLRISAYSTGSSALGDKELFFDNLMITAPGLPGDYNNNGPVDAADVVIWRKTLGQLGAGLAADANGNNRVDQDDYNIWRANFGSSSASAAGAAAAGAAAAAVPEPANWSTAAFALAGCRLVFKAKHTRRATRRQRSSRTL
jgi:hypothetical protein